MGTFSRLRTGRRDVAWMEMIRLRTVPGRIGLATDLLLDLTKGMTAEQGLVRVNLYQRAGLRTDLAMSLVWNTDPPSHKGTRTGLSISELLKTFGLVEHSVWLEGGNFPIFVPELIS
jgi:hypothetical protein